MPPKRKHPAPKHCTICNVRFTRFHETDCAYIRGRIRINATPEGTIINADDRSAATVVAWCKRCADAILDTAVTLRSEGEQRGRNQHQPHLRSDPRHPDPPA